MSLLTSKSVCIVTGASKGIGRSIAVNIAEKLPEGSLIIVLARGLEGLKETKKLVEENNSVECVSHTYDQGSLEQSQYDNLIQECLKGKSAESFQQAMIFHNAGSLVIDLCRDLTDVNRVSHYMNVNIAGFIALNAQFMKTFKDVPSKVVVNITSLASQVPMGSWGLYCSAKAARDMFLRNIAEEEEKYRVVSYAPGPIDTEMFWDVALVKTKHDKHLTALKGMKEQLLTPDKTVDRLLTLLDTNTFENGAHVDYFDLS